MAYPLWKINFSTLLSNQEENNGLPGSRNFSNFQPELMQMKPPTSILRVSLIRGEGQGNMNIFLLISAHFSCNHPKYPYQPLFCPSVWVMGIVCCVTSLEHFTRRQRVVVAVLCSWQMRLCTQPFMLARVSSWFPSACSISISMQFSSSKKCIFLPTSRKMNAKQHNYWICSDWKLWKIAKCLARVSVLFCSDYLEDDNIGRGKW